MKRISEYKDEAAIELWADLIEPVAEIVANDKVQATLRSKDKKPVDIAKEMLKANPKNVVYILKRIDDTPVDGVNVLLRLVDILLEMINNPDFATFFGFAVQNTESESSGSVTANTEAK